LHPLTKRGSEKEEKTRRNNEEAHKKIALKKKKKVGRMKETLTFATPIENGQKGKRRRGERRERK